MSERQMSPSDELATVLTGCAQILDVVKGEWGESWSEWDQSIRDGITEQLQTRAAIPQVTPTTKEFLAKVWQDTITAEQASPVSFVSGNSFPAPLCTFCGAAMVLKCLSCGSTSELTEQASPTPEKCPTCSSESKSIERWPCAKRYGGKADPWHSSAGTPKSRNTGVSLDGGKTIHSKFKND